MNDRKSCLIGPLSPFQRRLKAFLIRLEAALFYKLLPILPHPCNGDEQKYPKKIANFSKALPHNQLDEVVLHAYAKYIEALKTGNPHNFEKIPLGGIRKLVDPQAAYAFELIGSDSHQLVIPPPPDFSSAEIAGEMVELYWQALTRDVPFNEYDSNFLTLAAANELSSISDFRGPKINGHVTPGTLFRKYLPGALEGPYISQFLWMDIPYVGTTIIQRYRTTVPGDDHLTSYDDWLAVQDGAPPHSPNVFDPTLRYSLSERTGQTIHLVILDGKEGIYIDKVEGEEAMLLFSRIGRRIPLHSTAVGKVFMAFMSKEELAKLLEGYGFQAQTENTIITKERLMSELDEVRRQGYAIDNQEFEIGVRSAGVPIYNYAGEVIAAISLTTTTTRVDDKVFGQLITQLVQVGQDISERMGHGM